MRLVGVLASVALLATACGDDGGEAEPDPTETGGEGTEAPTDGATTPADGETAAAGGEGSIWVLLPDSASSARWETDDRRFFTQAFEEAGLTQGEGFEIVNAEGDPAQQQQQAEQAIASGASVLVLTNLDSGSGSAIIAQAREAGVKVVDYDRLTVEGEGADVYVSFDNVQVGRTMAEILEPEIEALEVETPRIVMLNGGPTDNNASLFKQGYAETVNEHVDDGDWELAADEDVPEWDNQEALRIFENILAREGNDVDATFAANDGLANSVISALKSAGQDPIPLSGQDATTAGIQNILSGWQTMTVYKPIRAEAFAGAQAALALRAGEDVTSLQGDFAVTTINNGTSDLPFIALTPIGVTADNIAETVIADEFRTWEEICTGEFEEFCPPEDER
jgi:D-xylose transport system substrate-binding protein